MTHASDHCIRLSHLRCDGAAFYREMRLLCLHRHPHRFKIRGPVRKTVASTSNQSSVEWFLLLMLMVLIGLIVYSSLV